MHGIGRLNKVLMNVVHEGTPKMLALYVFTQMILNGK